MPIASSSKIGSCHHAEKILHQFGHSATLKSLIYTLKFVFFTVFFPKINQCHVGSIGMTTAESAEMRTMLQTKIHVPLLAYSNAYFTVVHTSTSPKSGSPY